MNYVIASYGSLRSQCRPFEKFRRRDFFDQMFELSEMIQFGNLHEWCEVLQAGSCIYCCDRKYKILPEFTASKYWPAVQRRPCIISV